MSDFPPPGTPIRRAGLKEACVVNGRQFMRKRGTLEWAEFELEEDSVPPTEPELEPLYLSLVHEKQGEGEPLHWSLFVAHENTAGLVYQVKGDAEHMTYMPSNGPVDVANSISFLTLYQLAVVTEQQATVVKEVADREPPPRAASRREVKENCQGWTVRVIAKLVQRGIVPSGKLEMARSMMQPV